MLEIIIFVAGLISGFMTRGYWEKKKRRWYKEDQAKLAKDLLKCLGIEIEEGISRCDTIIEIAMRNEFSLSRIYVDLWDASRIKLIQVIENKEIIRLLHKIYLRFDLINFNLSREDKTERKAGIGFAQQYLAEIKDNYNKLKEIMLKYNQFSNINEKRRLQSMNFYKLVRELVISIVILSVFVFGSLILFNYNIFVDYSKKVISINITFLKFCSYFSILSILLSIIYATFWALAPKNSVKEFDKEPVKYYKRNNFLKNAANILFIIYVLSFITTAIFLILMIYSLKK